MELTQQEIQAALESLQPGQIWIQPLYRNGECEAEVSVSYDETGYLVHYEVYACAQYVQLHNSMVTAAELAYKEARRWDINESSHILETRFK